VEVKKSSFSGVDRVIFLDDELATGGGLIVFFSEKLNGKF